MQIVSVPNPQLEGIGTSRKCTEQHPLARFVGGKSKIVLPAEVENGPPLSVGISRKAASPVREPGFCVSVRKLPTGRTIGAPVFQVFPDPTAPVQAPDGPPNCPVKLPPVVFATVIQLSVNAEPSEGAANNETPSINPAITTKLNILLAMFFSLAFVACCSLEETSLCF